MIVKNFAERFLPEFTVDVALLTIADGHLETLLTRRSEAPFLRAAALPGVFVGRDEPLEAAAARALRDKGGLEDVYLEQLFTFGDLHRDPRGRIVSVAYYALVPAARFRQATLSLDALAASIIVPWSGETGGAVSLVDDHGKRLELAFDHAEIIGMAVKRIRGKLTYAPIGFELLPEAFTLLDLQRIHEAILGRKLNKDSFRRKILASGLLEDTRRRQTATAYRPATLYRFKRGEHHG